MSRTQLAISIQERTMSSWLWPLFSSGKTPASKVNPNESKAVKSRSRSQEFRARTGTAELVGDIKVNKSKGRPNRAAYIAVDVIRATSRLKKMVRDRRSKSEDHHRKEYVAEVAQIMRRRSEEFLARDPQPKSGPPLHRKHGRLNRGSILWHDIKDPVVNLMSAVSGGNKAANKVSPERVNCTLEA